MPTSLYDVTVASYLQTLGAVAKCLEKGLAHCTGSTIDPGEMVDSRLAVDMLPLRFQIVSVAHHSLGAIEGVKAGVFKPPGPVEALDYRGLQGLVTKTEEGLQRFSREEIEALADRDMAFKFGDTAIPFTGENFLLSFSLPNFYFHATTAYGILRNKGVPLGKRDFMGRLRIKK